MIILLIPILKTKVLAEETSCNVVYLNMEVLYLGLLIRNWISYLYKPIRIDISAKVRFSLKVANVQIIIIKNITLSNELPKQVIATSRLVMLLPILHKFAIASFSLLVYKYS